MRKKEEKGEGVGQRRKRRKKKYGEGGKKERGGVGEEEEKTNNPLRRELAASVSPQLSENLRVLTA